MGFIGCGKTRTVKGTGFSPYISLLRMGRASQAAEKLKAPPVWMPRRSQARNLFTLKGHDFSRADKINRINRALAPEGRLSGFSSWNRPFSAACSAPEGRFLDLPFEARLKPKELSLGTGKLEGLIACAKH